jgi:uncharacterized protein YcnI
MRNLAFAAALAAATPVFAHVTLEQAQARADSYYKAVLRVPHGCSGSPTVAVKVIVPEGVTGVKPQPKTGWNIDIGKEGKFAVVSWSGGLLADEHYDEFALHMKLPDRPGATLHFEVEQRCVKGEHHWAEIPPAGTSAHDLKEPAPALRLAPK